MNILYLAAEASSSKNNNILKLCEKLGTKVFDGSARHTQETDKDLLKYVNNVTKELIKADGIVVEASNPSFDLGRFITFALQQHKPILLLYQNKLPKEFVLGATRLVSAQEYKADDAAELESTLKDFLKQVKKKKLVYRFNLMISRDINSYLMDKARANGISKADYIRQLIGGDMEETSSNDM